MLQQKRDDIYRDVKITLKPSKNTDINELENKKVKAFLKALKEKATKKGWTFKMTLVGSERKSATSGKKYIETKGRPKTEFIKFKTLKNYEYKNSPHIHILLEQAKPYTSIRDYIFDYWVKREGAINEKGHETTWWHLVSDDKDLSNYIEYMDMQSEFKRVLNL